MHIPRDAPSILTLPQIHKDERGVFLRLFDKDDIPFSIAQVNSSCTYGRGTVRGLHLLKGQHSEWKIIKVIEGSIFDLIVNLNANSPKYGSIFQYDLSIDSPALLIPPFHAHGFQCLTERATVAYCVDKSYVKHADSGINPLSNQLMSYWPIIPQKVSSKDLSLPLLERQDYSEKCSICKIVT